MKKELKWLISIAFVLVLINSYITLKETFENDDSKDKHSAGYFKSTDYGSKSSKHLNIANAKNKNTIQNGKKNIEKSKALLKKVNKVL